MFLGINDEGDCAFVNIPGLKARYRVYISECVDGSVSIAPRCDRRLVYGNCWSPYLLSQLLEDIREYLEIEEDDDNGASYEWLEGQVAPQASVTQVPTNLKERMAGGPTTFGGRLLKGSQV